MYKENGKLDTFKLERWYRKMDKKLERLENSGLPYDKVEVEAIRSEIDYEINDIYRYRKETRPEVLKSRHSSLEVWYPIFEEEIKKQLTQPAEVK